MAKLTKVTLKACLSKNLLNFSPPEFVEDETNLLRITNFKIKNRNYPACINLRNILRYLLQGDFFSSFG